VTGHASLRVLDFSINDVLEANRAAAGASLGALVAANAPALTELNVCGCDLGDDGLRALFEALPHNTHLRTLKCTGNEMSEACARDVLLHAVRANTSLRFLDATYDDEGTSARQAEALVAQRPSAD
jgi:Ran GTPase-activating protein (RanGAP) involved in mRNA processing and transport